MKTVVIVFLLFWVVPWVKPLGEWLYQKVRGKRNEC